MANHNIERDTDIIPDIVAATIVEQVQAHVHAELSPAYASDLVKQAERIYSRNESFRKQINASGNKGRDTLYAFMRHWLASILHKSHPAIYARLWDGFANGAEPPRRN